MCLAVPARILHIDETQTHALAETMGVKQQVNVQLIDTIAVGDYILVHAGFAIEKICMDYFLFLNETWKVMLEGT